MQKNRVFTIIIMLLLALIVCFEPVYAIECNGLLTVGAAEMLQDAMNIVRFAVPILLIFLGSFDMGAAVIADDKDALKKSTSKLVKRCIAAVVIFFIPLFVEVALNLPGIKGNIVLVDDPLCGIE